jgi:hypothetical protein
LKFAESMIRTFNMNSTKKKDNENIFYQTRPVLLVLEWATLFLYVVIFFFFFKYQGDLNEKNLDNHSNYGSFYR